MVMVHVESGALFMADLTSSTELGNPALVLLETKAVRREKLLVPGPSRNGWADELPRCTPGN
jgi:hypothetical protein